MGAKGGPAGVGPDEPLFALYVEAVAEVHAELLGVRSKPAAKVGSGQYAADVLRTRFHLAQNSGLPVGKRCPPGGPQVQSEPEEELARQGVPRTAAVCTRSKTGREQPREEEREREEPNSSDEIVSDGVDDRIWLAAAAAKNKQTRPQ